MHFLISLCIHMDGYEKTIAHFIEADNEDDAIYEALVGETHNTPLTRKQYDRDDDWWDDSMMYRVSNVRQIKNQMEIITLKRYM